MFVLYCKSYRNDVLRVKRLLDSIVKYNVDNIPFYISTPEKDRDIFLTILGDQNYTWVSDESICISNPSASLDDMYSFPGNISQQVIKSEFWRLNFCDNYLCLDSDAQFIKNFYINDFMMSNETPYTIKHYGEDLIQDAKITKNYAVIENFIKESNELKQEFNRSGPDYDFGPPPMIWSAKVWQALADHLAVRGDSLWSAIRRKPAEIRWYGEALLSLKSIPLHVKPPLFKFYHYKWQYDLDVKNKVDILKLKEKYIGIVYQSNWDVDLNLGEFKKSAPSRLWKRFKDWIKLL